LVGLLRGVRVAMAARAGNGPKQRAASLGRPILLVVGAMACCASVAGVVGFVLARNGTVVLFQPLASRVPQGRHVRFIADFWAHSASYLVGLVGGLALIVLTWTSRYRQRA